MRGARVEAPSYAKSAPLAARSSAECLAEWKAAAVMLRTEVRDDKVMIQLHHRDAIDKARARHGNGKTISAQCKYLTARAVCWEVETASPAKSRARALTDVNWWMSLDGFHQAHGTGVARCPWPCGVHCCDSSKTGQSDCAFVLLRSIGFDARFQHLDLGLRCLHRPRRRIRRSKHSSSCSQSSSEHQPKQHQRAAPSTRPAGFDSPASAGRSPA